MLSKSSSPIFFLHFSLSLLDALFLGDISYSRGDLKVVKVIDWVWLVVPVYLMAKLHFWGGNFGLLGINWNNRFKHWAWINCRTIISSTVLVSFPGQFIQNCSRIYGHINFIIFVWLLVCCLDFSIIATQLVQTVIWNTELVFCPLYHEWSYWPGKAHYYLRTHAESSNTYFQRAQLIKHTPQRPDIRFGSISLIFTSLRTESPLNYLR